MQDSLPTIGRGAKILLISAVLMGVVRTDDPGKYFLANDDSGKCFSENTHKVVKLEKWKSLVIVAGGNLAEIRPLLTIPQK